MIVADLAEYARRALQAAARSRAGRPLPADEMRPLLAALRPERQRLRVESVVDANPSGSAKLIRLAAEGETARLAPFRAGQYISLRVAIGGVETARAYSLVSSPRDLSAYEIAVKDSSGAEGGGFVSGYLCRELSSGDWIEASAPLGEFRYDPLFHGRRLVFVAGGCGVTPFLSMLRDAPGRDLDIALVYGAPSRRELMLGPELDALGRANPRLTRLVVLSEPEGDWEGERGFITADLLRRAAGPGGEAAMYYVVGPDAMRAFVARSLAELGVPARRVLYEAAPPPRPPRAASGTFACELRVPGAPGAARRVELRSGEPILNSLERAKAARGVPSACRAGACGLCRSRLLSGRIYTPDGSRLRADDAARGWIHLCVATPLSDLVLEIHPGS